MRKELNRFERVTDGAYFAVDTRVFESTITSYDPMVANSTILTAQQNLDEQVDDKYRPDIQDVPLSD